ncbi:MAG: hypothetical protein HC911_05895 [Chloroflexaceae bacterium]|nr:hypothetical protein [Chloroflexaceae bacterium]
MARSMWQQIVKRINTEYERRLRIASDLTPDGTTLHHHAPYTADTPVLIVEQAQEDYPNAASTVLIARSDLEPPALAHPPRSGSPALPDPPPAQAPAPDADADDDAVEIANIPRGTRT